MTALFFASELDSFYTSGDVSENTTAGTFDSTYGRCSIRVNTDVSYADTVFFQGVDTDFFFGGQVMIGSITTNRQILGFINSAGVEVFRVTVTGTAASCTLQMQYLLAGVWTNVGSAATVDLSTRKALNIQLTPAGNGTAILYIAGVAQITATGTNLSGLGTIAQARLRSCGVTYWSEVVCSRTSTLSQRVVTRYPSANGSDTSWTGDYTAVDDTAFSASDYIQADAGNLAEAFATSGGSATNTTVNAVAIGFRAQAVATQNATSATSLTVGVRHDGINYFGAERVIATLDTPHQDIWRTNPATSAAWQSVQIANLQPAMKSSAPVVDETTDPIPPIFEPNLELLERRRSGLHIY